IEQIIVGKVRDRTAWPSAPLHRRCQWLRSLRLGEVPGQVHDGVAAERQGRPEPVRRTGVSNDELAFAKADVQRLIWRANGIRIIDEAAIAPSPGQRIHRSLCCKSDRAIAQLASLSGARQTSNQSNKQ